jgi:hypothetical protein
MAHRAISEVSEEVITRFANGPGVYKRGARRDYNWS